MRSPRCSAGIPYSSGGPRGANKGGGLNTFWGFVGGLLTFGDLGEQPRYQPVMVREELRPLL